MRVERGNRATDIGSRRSPTSPVEERTPQPVHLRQRCDASRYRAIPTQSVCQREARGEPPNSGQRSRESGKASRFPRKNPPRVGKIISAIERIADGAMTRRVDGTKEMF